ncbi:MULTISPECIES: cellulase family glycosylhydrolase [Micromonospora]|uniref:Endoglucanase n=1 Tax=Micromonospora solifontis TaxID=2487138 RepID=A0ABX9WN95_9ACTN|nr:MULTISPECIES: cellulase family glycosylhydrolase [Micromonospora]NES14942.1 cellulase family glycosylhydrolase [Micromonospora sp. PPF5-17B]NES35135.1 cellulase family glycosylhydrolase [Micromonospora solifontis]NES55130.1 cellulase family glycosylhydrolase [Micromonospora sp. PPF5-6]RNM01121.1 beta-mannosidase [Micromonospora solifontis]
MKKLLSVAGAALLTVLAAVFAFGQPAHAAAGFSVSNGRLYDANGNEFIMRGVNHAHTWYPQQTSSFANIKALGANTVRVVLASGDRWAKNDTADVANVISLCKANKLICVLEVHDTTGYGEQSGAITLDRAVDYWLSIASALQGQEKYVIVNIGNEPYGNQGYGTWATDTANAIKRLRAGGLAHTIMVDGPNWGQDWSFTMRDNASTVFNADPQKNTVFSIHMYGVFDTAAEITDYLGRFRSAGLPIVVGEFGFNHSDGNPDEDTIMAYSQANGIGYLGWSWSGNGGGVEYLDMATNFDPNQLTSWGQRIFNGANGIKSTAKEASVYSGVTPTTPPPTTTPPTTPPPTTAPPTTPPPSGGCTASYTIVNSWQGGFQGEVKVTAGSAAINGWTTKWTFANGQTVTQSWNATISGSGSTYTARNVDYNGRLGAGSSTSFGFIGSWNGTNSVPAVTCTAS